MNNENYYFYLQKYPKDGVIQPIINIEEYFDGLRYSKLTGIDRYGKPKNIHSETYAESSSLRVYIPDIITRENPNVELELYFTGENRRDMYHRFVEFIYGCKLYYWDTCRNRKISIILNDAIEPSEDKLYGSIPYITSTFKFTNLTGQSEQSI